MLEKEIGKIKDRYIRAFVESALAKADPKFWLAPASSTGKYHPPEDMGAGGLIRHVQKGVIVVEQFASRAKFDDLESDMALAAFLLHDICKNGVSPWGEYTDYTHGFIAYNWLKQFPLNNRYIKEVILNAVRLHMAPWCYLVNPFANRMYSKEEMQKNLDELHRALVCPSRIELAVREGDYWSSRQTMSFLPGQSIAYDPRVHDTPKEWLKQFAREYGLKIAE